MTTHTLQSSENSNSTGKWHFFSHRTIIDPSPLVLERRRIYILPTQAGLMFALVLFVMLLGSMNYNNSMGYALTFLLGSMAIVSILHTHRTLLGLRIEVGKVAPVFAGETVSFQLWLDNRGQTARYGLVWHSITENSKSKIQNPKPKIDLPTNQRVSLIIPIPTTQRGRVFLGQIMVYSRFPLGLFHAWAYIHLDISTLVYPQPLGHKTLPSGKQSENRGEDKPRDGGGEDFIGYRHYQQGDSPRHVDWKAVAREQEWMIKQFGGMNTVQVWFTWDDVSMFNDLEAALSQLCLWILVAESQGARYGLKIPGYTFEPHTGKEHHERCLQALALFKGKK
ncbi:DUF58 domain-containing protein [Candidatus Parabeggiatoa sp. HSG14]|uniref:DUF58 domain-containing protein n=1 Tax=Candidatus Parabeggiatoa sp. HSG14 TaxID=3055593 RepID=UPI0025A89DA4|nr:DUF58 domain-containing protein [Thiotrichales bacterium HSG14]